MRKYTARMILSSGLLASSLVALVAYAVVAGAPESAARTLRGALVAAWLAHAVAIVIDVAGVGAAAPGARFGFAPALSATVWMVVSVYAVESRFVPLPGARRVLAGVAMAAVLLAAVYPGEFRPHAGTAWAPLHWVLGLASYGLFGAAVLHALLLDERERRLRRKLAPSDGGAPALPLLRLEKLTFNFVGAGFVLLTAAIALGVLFADPWRWDHKAVFSVLGWGTFAALLAGRHVAGWRGRRATRWLYVGALLLLLAYVGSRFVLEVLLRRTAAG